MATPFVTMPWQSPLAVSSVLVIGPTEEPLTLADGKLRAGLDWPAGDPRDDLMNAFIAAARSQVEQDTGLALLTQTRDITYAPITDPEAYILLPAQAWPVQSVTAPTGQVVAASMFTAQPSTRGLQFVTSMDVAGTWRIVAGWPDAAALKAEAPLLVQAVGLLTAHYATLGRDLASEARHMETVPQGYDACIAPYRLIWVP
jgi:uncharacterized phiE125 gp8 family phage protein